MQRILATFLLLGTALGCAAQRPAGTLHTPTVAAPEFQLHVKADPQLNRYDKNPHALLLCIYLLKEPDGFRQLSRQKDGIPKLLDCGSFDSSVVKTRQLVVQPGQETKDLYARGDGAKYLGLATGYYSVGRKRVTDISTLPGDSTAMNVRIELGPQEIAAVKVE